MPTTILVPLDGSALAERALPYAERLARATDGQLVLVRSALARTFPGTDPTDAQTAAVDEAEAYVARIASRLEERGLAVIQAVPYGPAAEEILDEIDLRQADLVVMSTHGRSGLGRWIYGSVADHVLRGTRKPVLLIPATCERSWPAERPLRVLVPLDGSALAEEALEVANQLTAEPRSELILLRAVEPMNYAYAEGFAYVPLDPEEELADANEYLDSVVARLRAAGQTVEPVTRSGYAAATIETVARENDVDLIAMATHGRGGIARVVLGSVATGTLQRASVPLLLVRPTAVRAAAEPAEAPATIAAETPAAPEPAVVVALSRGDFDLLERGLSELMFAPERDRVLIEPARQLLARLKEAEKALAAPGGNSHAGEVPARKA